MSRLYDRVHAKGCRPATRADFAAIRNVHDHTSRAERLVEINAAMVANGYPPFVDEEAFDRHQRAQSASDRLVVSDWRLDLAAIEDTPVVVADDVAAYLHSQWADGLINFAAQLGQIAPPFPAFWIESQAANVHGLSSWGVLLRLDTEDRDPESSGARWVLSGELILEQRKGDPFGPALHFFVNIDRNGHLMMVDADHPDMAMRPASAAFLTEDASDEVDLDCWNEELKFYVYAALLTVSFMHCKNVDVIEHHPPDGPSRRNLRRNGRALTTYKILDIEPMRRVLARDGHAETGGLASAMHICRGHFKTFTADAPLFGRLVGPYWWADHVRGDSAHGFALKDYRVRIQGGEFGRSYGQADETQPASPRQVGCDPDRSGRGHVAHAVTQNRLADAVCHAGYEPRSPTPDEPQFDVGWSTPDAIWLCEVKSLTAQNELAQMHKAIGQVIDYAHRIDADRAVRMMIAVEVQPTGDHWIAECAAHGIVLAWPAGFAAALDRPG